jgi:hypothetical protein
MELEGDNKKERPKTEDREATGPQQVKATQNMDNNFNADTAYYYISMKSTR